MAAADTLGAEFASFSRLTLVAAFALCHYLTTKCCMPPNPSPKEEDAPSSSSSNGAKTTTHRDDDASKTTTSNPLPHDKISITVPILERLWIPAFLHYTLHTLIAMTYPAPSPLSTAFCPNPSNLSPKFFTWNPYTATCILLILLCAPIRLLAYAQLGANFTFRLAPPSSGGLVTTGLYRYVQHPSYPALWAVMVANVALLLQPGGVAGCFLPGWVVLGGEEEGGVVVRMGWYGVLGLGIAVMTFVLGVRVKDEEAMLKREFGREWVEYHGRTARFVPGVW